MQSLANIYDRINNLDGDRSIFVPFERYVDELSLGNYTLSYSSIREFDKSPLHFLKYKTGVKEQTDAMKMGSLLHLLILQPHKFKETYIILKKADGFESNTWAKGENKLNKEIIELEAVKTAKIVSEIDRLIEALNLKDAILLNSMAGDLIRGCRSFEKSITFDWHNQSWKSYVDGIAQNYAIDLKKVPDANPNKLRWKLKDDKWHWQAFLYLKGLKMPMDDAHFFYNICYDGSGNVCVIRQSWVDLSLAHAELESAISQLTNCIISEDWLYSYEFKTDMGYYDSSEL